MKKIDINIVIMFVVGILVGFCVTYCTVSFVNSYKNISEKKEKENVNDNYVIYFDDEEHDEDIKDENSITNEEISNNYTDDNNVTNNIITNNDTMNNGENPVSYFENVSNSNDENVLKTGFILIVDFLFYDKEIGGFTFSELTNEAKLSVMKYALIIDQKIDSFFPGYKETIGNGVKTVYSNVKVFVVELYLDTVSVICDNNESLCTNAKADFQSMKDSFGVTWDFIKKLADSGTEKLKRWYEVFKA